MKIYLCAIRFSLFFTTTLLELHGTHMHDGGSDFVDIILFFLGETQYIEGNLYTPQIYLPFAFLPQQQKKCF